MTEDFYEGKAICNEVGGAVLTLLANNRSLTVSSLMDVIEQAVGDGHDYGEERQKAMIYALRILHKFDGK